MDGLVSRYTSIGTTLLPPDAAQRHILALPDRPSLHLGLLTTIAAVRPVASDLCRVAHDFLNLLLKPFCLFLRRFARVCARAIKQVGQKHYQRIETNLPRHRT